MAGRPPLEITVSRHFLAWLHEAHLSLAFTTYQTNRLFLIGLKSDGTLSAFERTFDRPMGLAASSERFYLMIVDHQYGVLCMGHGTTR